MKEIQITRLAMGDPVTTRWMPVCGPECPPKGHRVRVENPADFQAMTHAETRVRALHAVQRMRRMLWHIADVHEYEALLRELGDFGAFAETDTLDGWTYEQVHQLRNQLASKIAHVTDRLILHAVRGAYRLGWKGEPLPLLTV